MQDSIWKKLGRKAASSWGKPRLWIRKLAHKGARRRSFQSTSELLAEAKSDTYTGCDEGCPICNEERYYNV